MRSFNILRAEPEPRQGGFEGKAIPVTFRGRDGEVHFTRPDLAITARVSRPRPIFVEPFRTLASTLTPWPRFP